MSLYISLHTNNSLWDFLFAGCRAVNQCEMTLVALSHWGSPPRSSVHALVLGFMPSSRAAAAMFSQMTCVLYFFFLGALHYCFLLAS